MTSRLAQRVEVPEATAALKIYELAESIQDLAYYAEFQRIHPATQKAILRAYRILKQAVIFYRGADHGLVYDAPDYKFKAKEKPKC